MKETWMMNAKCANHHGFTELPTGIQQSICDQCPVVEDCLAYGIRVRSEEGTGFEESGTVYGGVAAESFGLMERQLTNV